MRTTPDGQKEMSVDVMAFSLSFYMGALLSFIIRMSRRPIKMCSRPQMGPEILYVMFLYGYLDSEPPFFAGGCIPDPPG